MPPNQKDSSSISRRRLLSGVGGAGAAAFLAGCTGGGGTGQQLPEGKLAIGQTKSPIEFDPIVVNDIPSIQVLRRVFDPLYTFGEGFDIVPKIASDKPEISKDGTRYVVPLKSEPEFQNGDPVTAEDVKYSFTVPVKEETPNAGSYSMIDSVSIVDERTVQFDLKYPYAAFRTSLATHIVPKSVREEDKETFNTQKPVGAGPFEFVDWTQGDRVELNRWDDYWDEPADLSEVTFVPVKEPTTRVTSMKTGELDTFKTVPPKLWDQVKNMEGTGVDWKLGVNYYYAGFNCKEGPTTDPKVREAIDYAVDLERAVKNFVEPAGNRMYSPVPKRLAEEWGFPLDEWKEIPHGKDVDQTKSMLDESDNVPDDWECKIIVPPDDKRENIGVSIANGIEEAGYKAQVQRLNWSSYANKYNTGNEADYNIFVLGSGGGADPDAILYWLFTHEQFGKANGCWYENEEMDDALMTARQITDDQRRKELYTKAVRLLLEDRAHLPVYGLRESWAVKDTVNGFSVHPYGQWNPRLVTPYTKVSVDE